MRNAEREFILNDVESLAAHHPDTFRIPSREMRDRLCPGDLVKLHFRHVETGHVERMWVETRAVGPLGYEGVLDNDPTRPMGIVAGEPVGFLPEHVGSIWIESDHNWGARIALPPHAFWNVEG